ncbi:hypothetical protein C5167_039892 [Papaver somniferum]|uniref:Uncharacterized protein n=1 Tax=Papaver somniferum TaxID=3469 RepID=A0A4Y7IDG3_PAPSO|nr:uncharacterized protein LOC113311820 [Papaver somniferum]XP_026416411.1 uncharacterized protein LOC113311820 [Papaver somniferum]XP_026416417.1 uncharacterized protein LOC113311820 [Papaver somniferum]XP_026416421.1 uncharacterized protein LOC113311820 [Papaver somniferum]XP_026416426.1 uncharacterized protein LOC113311820 [Papaver somniferum]RZC46953.1 hypothetical protein C5167_039892 [Papaver somniferum]
MMNNLFSQRTYVALMQNCDLPPPQKVFARADKSVINSTTNTPPYHSKNCGKEDEFAIPKELSEIEKMNLLRALQLSQTRAREAEKKAKVVTQERDNLANSFLRESLRMFAYKQWVKLLEFEVSQLQSQNEDEHKLPRRSCETAKEIDSASSSEEEEVGNEDDGSLVGNVTWYMALALCFGFAGVGFVFGCRYYYII